MTWKKKLNLFYMDKLNESKGTPDLIVNFVNDNITVIKKCILLGDKCEFSLNDKNLKCDIIINFNKSLIKNYTGNINNKLCVKSDFKNCVININYPQFYDIDLIIKTLYHELTHLYELYQIRYIYDKTKWVRSDALCKINRDSEIKYFIDIFYLSLPMEINARVSSLYHYLYTKDISNLENELKNTTEWRNCVNLHDFDVKNLYNDLIEIFSDNKETLYFIFNEFNDKMLIKTIINNDVDLYNYLMNSKRYFKKVAADYKKRMLRVINKIIIENENIEYVTYDPGIVDYKDYVERYKIETREKNLKYLLNSIDYLNFFHS